MKDIPKLTLALMWLYLQIIGKPTEKFLNEINFWTFDRADFKSAITCLMLNDDEEMDETSVKMKELIAKHLKTDKKLYDWARATFKQVNFIVFHRNKCHVFQ